MAGTDPRGAARSRNADHGRLARHGTGTRDRARIDDDRGGAQGTLLRARHAQRGTGLPAPDRRRRRRVAGVRGGIRRRQAAQRTLRGHALAGRCARRQGRRRTPRRDHRRPPLRRVARQAGHGARGRRVRRRPCRRRQPRPARARLSRVRVRARRAPGEVVGLDRAVWRQRLRPSTSSSGTAAR